MLFDYCLSDKRSYTAKHKAKYEQYSYGLVIYRTKKIVAVFRRIAAVCKILSVGIGSYYDRKIIGAYPETENTAADDGLFEALIIS